MGCIYSDWEGNCSLSEKGIERPCVQDGACVCEDDPNPEGNCENFESNSPKDEEW